MRGDGGGVAARGSVKICGVCGFVCKRSDEVFRFILATSKHHG